MKHLYLLHLLPEEVRTQISEDATHIIALRTVKRAYDILEEPHKTQFLALFESAEGTDEARIAFFEIYLPSFSDLLLEEAMKLRDELAGP